MQGLLKKYEAFETDLEVHSGRVQETESAGRRLIQKASWMAEFKYGATSSCTKERDFFS